MKKTYSNPCIRCGTERVVLKTWKEKIYDSTIINTEMICPDKECQKKVNSENKKLQDKYVTAKLRSEQRVLDRKVIKDAEREAKKI